MSVSCDFFLIFKITNPIILIECVIATGTTADISFDFRCILYKMEFDLSLLGVFWLLINPASSLDTDEVHPVGDPRKCFVGNNKIFRFEVIPGGGWDNLINKDTGMIMELNYSRCRTTDDGKFLIPDDVYTIPIKSSKVETYAELITHWDNYTSTLSRSVNAHGGLHFSSVSISGKYSSEYKSVKSRQYYDKSMTTRVQARYVLYTAMMEPSAVINDAFRSRLQKLATYVTLNRTDLARYESQLLVRDYGTHVITSIDVGAALAQIDEVSANYVRKYDSEKHKVVASASASFFGVFDFGAGYSETTTKTMIDEYKKERTSSAVITIGGPAFRPKDFTANNWTDFIANEMVALDRSGEPLYSIIRDSDFPNVPQSVTFDVIDYVKEAVHIYYEHNSHRGCTNPDSPNFSFQANMNDDSCHAPMTNFTFGGVYQTCEASSFPKNLCSGKTQKNPLTGSYNCPSGYEAVPLHRENTPVCHKCWFFFTCCSTPSISAYWCAASGQVAINSGFLFGGLFTSTVVNVLTQHQSCPPEFYPIKVLGDLTVCVSNDYELGYRYSLPFGGFFSCNAGNPLSLKERVNSLQSSGVDFLTKFMMEQGVESYPKTCPKGYSQHLAVVYAGCSINYCVRTGALSEQGLPKVQRPPFMKAPRDQYTMIDDKDSVFSDDQNFMARLKEVVLNAISEEGLDGQYTELTPAMEGLKGSEKTTDTRRLSSSGIAAISVSATLVCVLIGTTIVITIKRRKSRPYKEVDPWARSTEDGRILLTGTRNYSRMDDTPVVVSST
ncbi:macrophage-expressed gene 1 protein-like [Mercenaria mercenaria]|uniref:macrophage-expressed gene 1 protein-like n=1 Tax=Mercenaria mercenaria TaxID=6596 RepID=UPI00234F33C7|nr:macrophage-expressed gene 1 protein-like [Mercenaria mercenaria]